MVKKSTQQINLERRAKKLGFTLWQSGGYYYLSGNSPSGKHQQGIFTTLRGVRAQIETIEKFYEKLGKR